MWRLYLRLAGRLLSEVSRCSGHLCYCRNICDIAETVQVGEDSDSVNRESYPAHMVGYSLVGLYSDLGSADRGGCKPDREAERRPWHGTIQHDRSGGLEEGSSYRNSHGRINDVADFSDKCTATYMSKRGIKVC